jgi:hypothetical protein
MSIAFREHPTQENDFQLEVRKSGVLLGYVRRDGDFFQYCRGAVNDVMFEFEDDDLDRLKQRIALREAPAALTY